MNVPLFDLKEQHAALADQMSPVFSEVLASGAFILGDKVSGLEQAVAESCGAEFGIGVSSGTDALLLSLMALDIGPGDEVICPAFTFFATAGSVARLGATPVFADVCPVCFNLDLASTEAAISDQTKAIIPVHLFGQAAEMDGLLSLAETHGLAVIEDVAQAQAATYRGRPVGGLGTFGALSFFPTKNLGGLGDGGMVVTNDADLADRARILRNHGADPKYYHGLIGGNFRLDALQAAMLQIKLPHLEGYLERRAGNAAYYLEQLAELEGVVQADAAQCGCVAAQQAALGDSRIVLPTAYDHCGHTWNQFTIRVRGEGTRERLRTHLSEQGIGFEVYYPVSLDQQKCFTGIGRTPAPPTVSHQLAAEVLSLPIFPELKRDQQDEVIASLARFLETDSSFS